MNTLLRPAIRIAKVGALLGLSSALMTASAQNQPAPDNKQAGPTVPDDRISYDSLTLELALVKKTLADERFLAGDRTGARNTYCEAKKEANQPLILSTPKRNTLTLLNSDIDYRLMLLQGNFEFWGAVQSLRPSMPAAHLAALEGLLLEYEKLSGEITAAAREINKDNVEIGKLKALEQELDGKVLAENVNQERITIQKTFQENRQDALDRRIDELLSNRRRLENEVATAVSNAKAASAQFTKIIVNAASASVGIPPDVAQAAQSGDVKTAVFAAVTKSDLMKSPQFTNAMADLRRNNETIAAFIKQGRDLVRKANEYKEQYETYKRTFDDTARLMRKPSLEGLVQVGGQIYENLDQKTKSALRENIRAAKPVIGAVELVHTIKDPDIAKHLRSGVETFLSTNSNFASDFLRTAITAHVDEKINDIEKQYSALLGEVSKVRLNIPQVEDLTDKVMQAWPNGVLSKLQQPAIDELLRATGISSPQELTDRLRLEGINLIRKNLRITTDRIEIRTLANRPLTPPVFISLADLGAIPANNKIEKFGASVKAAFEDQLNRLRGSENELRKILLKRLPVETLEAAFRQGLSVPNIPSLNDRIQQEVKRKEDAWSAVVLSLSNSAQRERVVDAVASLQVGSDFVADQESKTEANQKAEKKNYSGGDTPSAPNPAPANGSPEDLMVRAALDAALPGASVAIDVVKAFFAFSDAVDAAQKAAAELQANLREELQVIELVNEARLKQVILGKEREISAIMKEAARAQYESYRFAATQVAANQGEERTYIFIRRKLAFYLAERMREEFDALDRSLALWSGRKNSPRGIIAEMIKADPQNVRLALDSEIHLFDWLERDRESTRADVDGLLVHWRQLTRLSKDLCARLGCVSGAGALGQVNQTEVVKLSETLSALDLERLRLWQTSGRSEPITLTLLLSPDGRHLPQGIDNARVIDVRLGTTTKTGQLTALNRVRLFHPGMGYVLVDGVPTREAMLPIGRWGHAPPAPFDLQELSESWRQSSTGRARDFEGYPVFTAWQLTLEAAEENRKATDIELRFAYRYIDRANIYTERQYVDGPQGGASGLFEAAVVWNNIAPQEARINVGGRPKLVALPPGGRIPVPFNALPLLIADRTPITGNVCDDAAAPGDPREIDKVVTISTQPKVVAVCKDDQTMKRQLIAHYSSNPNRPAAEVQTLAAQELARLKREECAAIRPLSALRADR